MKFEKRKKKNKNNKNISHFIIINYNCIHKIKMLYREFNVFYIMK